MIEITRYAEMQRYTKTIMTVLEQEDDEVTGENYYIKAAQLISGGFARKGVTVSETAVYALIWSAVVIMLENRPDAVQFVAQAYPRDFYIAVKAVILTHMDLMEAPSHDA